jgi:crossover junction endodeoxyribonuclease RuvC
VHEYTPLEVKQNVCGYGRGGKEQIQEMVRIQLGLDCIPKPDDAADALAVCICHIGKTRVSRLLAGSQ